MADKPKVAFYWCASCGGCEEAVVDLAEDVLGVLDAVDIVFWPVALDFKRKDVEAMPDGAIVAGFINGAVRTTEQEEMARLMRRKCKVVIAFGSCSHMGGIPGLANAVGRAEILKFNYEDGPCVVNPSKVHPAPEYEEGGHKVTLPVLHEGVRALDQVIDVDFYLPGCAPTPKLIKAAIGALLSGKLPPKGSVLAPETALCDECPRKETKPETMTITEFKRPHLAVIDPEKCLLAQGFACMGPATRAGCEALCPTGNMPCTGCFGPTGRVMDQGAKILSSLASNVEPKDEAGIAKALSGIPDPVGTFYRYGLAKSILRRRY